MAKKSQTPLLKKLIIIAVTLAVLEGLFIFIFSSKKPLTSMQSIDEAVNKLNDVSPERRELARVQLAISDYMRENNGTPPSSLQVLIPKYFDSVPIDRGTNKAYKYRVEGTRFFLGEDTNAGQSSAGGGQVGATGAKGGKGGEKGTPSTGSSSTFSDAEKNAILASLNDDNSSNVPPYDPTGRRDPFRPVDLSPRDDGSDKTPLERIPINQLTYSAFLESETLPKAIIETAEGKGFTVVKGTKIGPNGGEIVEILPDKISIVETEIDFTGEKRTRTIELFKGLRAAAEAGAKQ